MSSRNRPQEIDRLADAISQIAKAFGPKEGWCDKYGADFESEVFSMHRYWDGQEHGENVPNFFFKPLGLKVWWYKYIGRSMEANQQPTKEEIAEMLTACLKSQKGTFKQVVGDPGGPSGFQG